MKKVIVTVKEIKAALKAHSLIIAKRTTLPILGTVKLKANTTWLGIDGTDLDLFLSNGVTSSQESEAWETCAPFHDLKTFVDGCSKSGNVSIEFEQETVGEGKYPVTLDRLNLTEVETGIKRTLKDCLSKDEFPPRLETSTKFSILRRMDCLLPMTCWAASTQESRYVLNGVHIETDTENDRLIAVATDGRRLSLADIGLGYDPGEKVSETIPSHALEVVKHMMKDNEDGGNVEFWHPKRNAKGEYEGTPWAAFSFTNGRLGVRVIDGTYPNWRQVVPSDMAERYAIKVNAKEFHGVLSRLCKTVKGTSANSITFTPKPDSLHLSNTKHAVEMSVAAKVDSSDNWTASAFDPCLMVDAVKAYMDAGAADVKILAKPADFGSGCLVMEPVQQTDSKRPFFIQMPMRMA